MATSSTGFEEEKVLNDLEKIEKEHPRRPSTSKSAEPEESNELSLQETPLPPPPDGGLHAWLKVFGGFLVYINIWGFTLSYGAFQTYYKDYLLASSNPSAISWIGTIQAWLLILVGVLSGPFFDLGYFRVMLYLGNFLVVFGIMMLSLCDQYWQVLLAQGLCMGLGAGLLYIPSLAMVGVWFSRKRAVAMGICMSGIAVGGVIDIIMFDKLVHSIGFPWTIRSMGFVALFCAVASFPALTSGSGVLAQPRKARKLFDKSAFKDRLFLLFTCCTFFTFLGYITPYFYIPSYAKNRLGMSESKALYTLVVSVGGSFFGRIGTGFLAHYIGVIFTWLLCALAGGILSFSWISIETHGRFIAFSVLWGFLSAGLVTLPSAVFASICPDLSRLGTRMGMSWSVSSVASLIGAPIAGALIRESNGREAFIGVQAWSGACLILGTAWITVLWLVVSRTPNKGWKV